MEAFTILDLKVLHMILVTDFLVRAKRSNFQDN